MQKLADIITENQINKNSLFKLKQEFIHNFEQYIRYQKIQEEFDKQLKKVLFTLQHKEF